MEKMQVESVESSCLVLHGEKVPYFSPAPSAAGTYLLCEGPALNLN